MLYQQIARNKRKTWGLLIVFLIILALVGAGLGYLLGDDPLSGIIIALIASVIYLFIVYGNSSDMVMSLNHAQEIHEKDNPQLWLAYCRRYGFSRPSPYAPRVYYPRSKS
ncbi:hypothetical protein LCB40_15090 [Lactobacillus corticis]|uniref:Zinc metalloprotease HtpX n=1 Tax=Lactobacillus corticis TaxID=2201249 RepID=A0A916VJB8_9LACO|nr:hypothetical protein LCB40_15090 [Lactobacillus corticis]